MLAALALAGLLLVMVGGRGDRRWHGKPRDQKPEAARRRGETYGGLEQFAGDMALALSSGCRPVEALRRCSHHRGGPAAMRGFTAVLRIERGLDPLAAFSEASVASASQAESALYAALAGEMQSGAAAAPSVAAIARTAATEARVREADRAARAAPLVQLIVALGLVPSALLIGGAVLLAGLGRHT
jgi:tight adherence protein C